jgi:hypothetical protein
MTNETFTNTPVSTGTVHKYKIPESKSNNKFNQGITVVFPAHSLGKLSTAVGTRFFLEDGTELAGVTNISMKETGTDDILSINLTFPITKVVYADD